MTSEVDGLKTNEFLRRRKLRLLQVREQSKDIAKKIRQRAKVEKVRQVVELDAKKQSEYLQRQERLVKQLEHYYSKGIQNVGKSHKNATEITGQDVPEKLDLSKQRGKEATAELRNKRQKILDEQKKKLDRRLQAREIANEISREKSASVLNKVLSVPAGTEDRSHDPGKDDNTKPDNNRDIAKSDMGTQWDLEEIPEWEPAIPTLALPKDDNNSVKESNNNIVDSKSDKSRRLDLFALSEEMPSSLRGGNINHEERIPEKSSLTLVSEYLRNRGLRLRETDTVQSSSKKSEELQSLKQTILRTRASTEVSAKEPSQPNREKKSNTQNSAASRKPSVTVYNHATRDSRDIPCNDQRLVVRDTQDTDDAYSQAMKESTTDQNIQKTSNKKIQDNRSKVAMTKQNVEKEYRDTISFLNALPKDKGTKPIKTAYMDEQRQQMQKDNRQQKMQHEYRKIEKECSKNSCRKKRSKVRRTSSSNGDVFESSDFQYSWMPVPEGDGNLAIHTIPTTLKEGRSGNTVKFSQVDSYHEYRSRHKHTPPTKDTTTEKPERYVNTTVIENSSDSESVSSNSSENIRLETREGTSKNTEKLSDAERIIIYKILDSKVDKTTKHTKLMKDIAKSLSVIEKQNLIHRDESRDQSKGNSPKKTNSNVENRMSFEQLNEGIYKAVTEDGDNISSMYFNEQGEKVGPQNKEKKCHPCFCKKKQIEEPQDAATTPQWESVGLPTTSRMPQIKHAGICHCGNKKNPRKDEIEHPVLPSAATSTTSFKTATNDKASNAVLDGGFIKLLDDGGEETGKFYIGASGLLKDEAYEVVIKLRKKIDDKESREREAKEKIEGNVIKSADDTNFTTSKASATQIEASHTDKSTVVSEPIMHTKELQVNVVSNFIEIPETRNTKYTPSTQTVLDSKNPEETEISDNASKPPATKKSEHSVNVISEVFTSSSKETMTHIESFDNIINNPAETEPIKFSEKGVSTSFQESFAIPSHVPKVSVPRPATSTYTQTSICSPSHKPILLHMSSSTSTAYMSPPEMILPPFLRSDYHIIDDLYDAKKYDMNELIHTEQHEYSEEYECGCRKCAHKRNHKIKHVQAHHQSNKENIGTPPNTARNGHTRNREDIFCSQDNINNIVPPISNNKSKCKCRKCAHSSSSHKRSRHLMSAKHSSRNVILQVTSSGASSNKGCRLSASKRNINLKSNLKPIIKNYVDKLLVLNRESLKAVQVIDQECSTVSTPGSSIIEVPNNIDQNKPAVGTTISLHQIGNIIKQKHNTINQKDYSHNTKNKNNTETCFRKQYSRCRLTQPRVPRKKTGHKLKSLNIPKHMYKEKKTQVNHSELSTNKPVMSCSSTKAKFVKEHDISRPFKKKIRSKSSPTPRLAPNSNTTDKSAISDRSHLYRNRNNRASSTDVSNYNTIKQSKELKSLYAKESSNMYSIRNTLTSTSTDSDRKCNNVENPMSISTQTSLNVDSEINYIKLAEDKLHNMEKIADLTEKCTQRLSNLAKVLEEVRKNKSLVYNQISSTDTTSDSDHKSDTNTNQKKTPQPSQEKLNDNKTPDSVPTEPSDMNMNADTLDSTDYIPFLSDIPKPVFKNLNPELVFNSSSKISKSPSPAPENINYDHLNKSRGRPPPALSRIHLKHVQDCVIPHELSTVVEVDSPMSIKLKSSRNDTRVPDISGHDNKEKGINFEGSLSSLVEVKDTNSNDALLSSNADMINQNRKVSATDSSDNSKIQMIDMNQFNEIMLKPFFSIQEYAKHCNIGVLDDGSNLDSNNIKDDPINDEFSSLHSDGSLPDVIAELLKRNIISEPFKFDTASNANSTTVSSESTISVLALSRARQGKRQSSVTFHNKDNMGETSDTLSISSNPDLEKAFKKLGMGWASSTLKKTKERLALSSSSNTSSSSLSQFKVRSFNQDIPAIVTDTVSSVLHVSSKPVQANAQNSSKHAEQQTSLTNSMTVKEFLANELAKKITFNKSTNDTDEEFMSLFETKMPEEMKHSSRVIQEEHSIDNSMRSGNNRARTSTPVQLFKSMTYHSSSSSNMSNGLFSNADDLSSVKVTSNSMKHSTSDKDDLVIPNFSLRMKRGSSECSKSD